MRETIAFNADYLLAGRSPEEIARTRPELGHVWASIRGTGDGVHYGRPHAWHQQAARRDFLAAWAEVEAPVLVVYGEYDQFETRHGHALIAATVNRLRPGTATFVELPGADHELEIYASAEDAYAYRGGRAEPELFLAPAAAAGCGAINRGTARSSNPSRRPGGGGIRAADRDGRSRRSGSSSRPPPGLRRDAGDVGAVDRIALVDPDEPLRQGGEEAGEASSSPAGCGRPSAPRRNNRRPRGRDDVALGDAVGAAAVLEREDRLAVALGSGEPLGQRRRARFVSASRSARARLQAADLLGDQSDEQGGEPEIISLVEEGGELPGHQRGQGERRGAAPRRRTGRRGAQAERRARAERERRRRGSRPAP